MADLGEYWFCAGLINCKGFGLYGLESLWWVVGLSVFFLKSYTNLDWDWDSSYPWALRLFTKSGFWSEFLVWFEWAVKGPERLITLDRILCFKFFLNHFDIFPSAKWIFPYKFTSYLQYLSFWLYLFLCHFHSWEKIEDWEKI